MKLKNYLFLAGLVAFGLIAASPAQAHNPRLVYDEDVTLQKPVIITNPDISQAFTRGLRVGASIINLRLARRRNFIFLP